MDALWETLKCSTCGVEEFNEVIGLRWKEGQGLTKAPAGYKCIRGHNIVVDSMIRDVKERLLQNKIDELKLEQENAKVPAKKEPAKVQTPAQ
jgi:hypothetical protein